ncbi:MAG: AAA family ATPase [Desulfobacteraceae bacterium]|jgi:endopeptidase Clp ATP-binding regulatory subunit ClpX
MEDFVNNEKKDEAKLPNQKELEKELSEYLSKKYGNRIKIVSPFIFPKGQKQAGSEESEGDGKENALSFNLLPEQLERFLDEFVVKQDDAKAVLSTKICTHFNRTQNIQRAGSKKRTEGVGMIKNNVLMIGPTGVGKTYIIKLIAQKLGVPFVKGDATKFSETGYVGGDVEDLVRDLVNEADDDIKLAENGIIYIDEIDKIASSNQIWGHDVSRTGVQRALLKPMEETDVDMKVPHDAVSQIQAIEHYRRTGKKDKRIVNTKNILFIMSGAFGDLAEIIKKRLQKQGIGFEADVRPTEVPWEILKEVRAQDLIEFGFESEFVGRLPVVVVFDELTQDDLVQILKNPNNPVILSKRQDFRAYGIDIKFEEEALKKIAERAAAEKTGARGLVSAIERVLIPFEKHLPSTSIRCLVVTPELMADPKAELERLTRVPEDPERAERFAQAARVEAETIHTFVSERAAEYSEKTGLDITAGRVELIADYYLKRSTDVNTAVEAFQEMVAQVKAEEASLQDKIDIRITFDDTAVDELIKESINSGHEAGPLAFHLAKKLEYGLKLVRDRAGTDEFVLNAEAVRNMEKYIDDMVKTYYRREVDAPYTKELEN